MNIDPSYYSYMFDIIKVGIYGAIGCFLRAWIGFQTKQSENPTVTFDKKSILFSIINGILIGIVSGMMLKTIDPQTIIPLAYAGLDALKNLLTKNTIQTK